MKIRHGFVSNSSSSSFTCCICGEEGSGMHDVLKDFEMIKCKIGHIFCEDHLKKEYNEVKICREDLSKKDLKDMGITKIELDEWSDEEIREECSYYIRYNFPQSLCPICNFEHITDDIILEYLLIECKSDKNNMKKEMVKRFGDYEGFLKWVEAEKKSRPIPGEG